MFSCNQYDKLFIDFGSIKNTGPDFNLLTLYFSVVLTKKDGKIDNKHAVTVGAEYNKGAFAWVAQSLLTTGSLSQVEHLNTFVSSNPTYSFCPLQSDDQIFSNVDIVPATGKVHLDSGTIFNLIANLEFRSDNFRIEISKPSFVYEPENLISLGRINIVKFGKNYESIPNIAEHYSSYRNKTVSVLSFSKSVFEMGYITNTGERARTFTNNPENKLEFTFSMYALNYKENVDKSANITIKMFLGTRNFFSKTINVTIGEKRAERIASKLVSSTGQFTNHNVTKGGLTQLKLKSIFLESASFTDYFIAVEVPRKNNASLIIPCSAKLINEESGFNFPYLNGTNIKAVHEGNQYTFNFGRIQSFVQRALGRAEDNQIVAEITYRVPFLEEIIEDGKQGFNMFNG